MVYIKDVVLHNVRNIPPMTIHLDDNKRKHLILTGPNGSGKTTLIKELNTYLARLTAISSEYNFALKDSNLTKYEDIFTCNKANTYKNIIGNREKEQINKSAAYVSLAGDDDIYILWLRNEFIICDFIAHRKSEFIEPDGPTKLEKPKTSRDLIENHFVQLLVNLRSRQSFANDDGDMGTVDRIKKWFDNFKKALSTLLGHSDFKLLFDTKKFTFTIEEKGKEPYHFSELPDGYSALLYIVSGIMLRMSLDEPLDLYDKQGIVLIDEVETHLHVELQKKVMPFLTNLFPQIQFIVSTHSPFVLSSIKDSVIFDMKKLQRFEDFSEYSYSSIIEDYYGVNPYSDYIVDVIQRIEQTLQKEELTEEEIAWIKDTYHSVMNIPETQVVSPELRIKLKELIIKNSSKLHGLL